MRCSYLFPLLLYFEVEFTQSQRRTSATIGAIAQPPRFAGFSQEWIGRVYKMKASKLRWHVDVDPWEI